MLQPPSHFEHLAIGSSAWNKVIINFECHDEELILLTVNERGRDTFLATGLRGLGATNRIGLFGYRTPAHRVP